MIISRQPYILQTTPLLFIMALLCTFTDREVIYANNPLPHIGAMGDSNTDEYGTNKNIPGLNWVEQLVISRGLDFGAFSETGWGEPRRIGYEYNWARDGATATGNRSYDLHSQWLGLAEQVDDGKIDLVFLTIGNNDFFGKGFDIALASLAGDDLKLWINSISGRIEDALNAVSAAGDIQLLLGNVIDVGLGQDGTPVQLARVTDAVARVNDKIQFVANEKVIPVMDFFGLQHLRLQDSLEIGGVLINPKGMSDDPHDFTLSDGHWGTVVQGLLANMFVEAINRAYGYGIEPLSDQEILVNAGIPVPNPGGEPTYYDISGFVLDPSGPAIADFNKDRIVDAIDMCALIDHWNTDEPRYDIGPPPYGDNTVDVQDLLVLAEHLFEEILPVELVAYWKLDETEGTAAHDTVGGYTGSLHGDPLWQPAHGQKSGALQFDGVDDYFSTDFVLNPSDGSFSVLVWMKGDTPGQVIVSQLDDAGGGKTWLGAEQSQGGLVSRLSPPASGRSVPEPLSSGAVITDGQWHHVAFIWDGSYRSLYADGVEVAKDTAALGSLESATGGLHVGAAEDLNDDSFFSGLIDDLRIYDVALTAEEVAVITQ